MGAQSIYEVIDPRFGGLINGNARLDQLYTGCKWSEGPAWFGGSRSLVWSDIPNNRQMRFDESDGSVSVFRSPSDYSNGNTVDRQGRQVTCEHGARRVTRTEHDGTITVIADRFEGKRLNSPNDVIVKSDESIWFTDPTYGIDSDYEGHKSPSEIGGSNVYRVDPATGAVTAVITDMIKPNGLAFSLDEQQLYVADTGRTHGAQYPKHIRVFDVQGDRVTGGRVFADCTAGLFDGFRLDVDGRIWTSAEDGVHCYEPDGTLIGKILVPEVVANVCFGGVKRNRLYICATTSLYAVYVMTNGAKTY
ncbi:MAG: gluconolactonase [Devosia sp. 67-54]|uniref:SMP-30/gluconolactonase/LRE family protein n=1 Tax=unclassified Devosia TaxID=196773 RepID=UPI00095AABE9|nr:MULTISPECIES: SMP-30/gluconolactonase/LRE family protein [unclassified Devosia]MBN9305744.1 SMP-30/gluconolactonase/LRE family protein [Devosia sp.]OJX16543.1 MAG: gluconolactonase [Devosia sp. 67-54]